MIDIKLIRENKELVIENLKRKFQDEKIASLDEIIKLDVKYRSLKTKCDDLRANKNKISSDIGELMRSGKKQEAEAAKAEVVVINEKLVNLEQDEVATKTKLKELMMTIPNIIADDVPLGKDDSENVELEKYGEPIVPDYEIPYHADIAASLDGVDFESSRRVSGQGFYYLTGNLALLHSAILTYARDFMIKNDFTFVIPPFLIRSAIVEGVMSFTEMDDMMYKIEGEDLYLIGTSEHSMIGKYIDTIIKPNQLPQTLTSYSPCFRKEKGAHGIEERGLYRVHQFEKQEMIVVCDPSESDMWYEKMWQLTVEFIRSLDIPVRTLECCSGDLPDLKHKSVDVEAWSPRQQKYFEAGSCSNLTDAQSRRLNIRVKGENETYHPHTLNNTVLATPRILIAFLENNYNADGSINIPASLQPYMQGMNVIKPKTKQ